ncbi:MAG: hypothetical protein ACT443_11445 [Gemmatimonadota bacterium]
MAAFALALAVLLAAAVTVRVVNDAADPVLDTDRMLVLPFRATVNDSSLGYLREGLVDLVAASLGSTEGPHAVDPRSAVSAWNRIAARGAVTERAMYDAARNSGAGQLMRGEIVRAGAGQIVLSARLSSVSDRRHVASALITGSPDSIPALVERLLARLLVQRSGEHSARVSAVTNAAPAALRAFLQARAEQRRGNNVVATQLYANALESDSAFALAGLELLLASGRLLRWSVISLDGTRQTQFVAAGSSAPAAREHLENTIQMAWRERAQLGAADLAMLTAVRGDYPRAAAAAELLQLWEKAATYDRPEAHYAVGLILLNQGPSLGITNARVRARTSFARALGADSGYTAALAGLVEVAAIDRDRSELRRLARLYLQRDAAGSQASYVRWRTAGVLGDRTLLQHRDSFFHALDTPTLDRIALVSQMDAVRIDDADAANAERIARINGPQDQHTTMHRAHMLALNRGRPAQALRFTTLKREAESTNDFKWGFAIRDALFWDGDRTAAEEAVRGFEAELRELRKAQKYRRAPILSLALWRISHGDTTGVAAAIRDIRNEPALAQAQMLDVLLAMAIRRADLPAALLKLDSIALLGCCSFPHFINLVSARAHEQQGDRKGALAAIRRGYWLYPPEYLSTYLREEGRLAALLGERAAAVRAYKHYLALRSKVEPSLSGEVNRVRRELARLEAIDDQR